LRTPGCFGRPIFHAGHGAFTAIGYIRPPGIYGRRAYTAIGHIRPPGITGEGGFATTFGFRELI
jgi:hypothetical protein